MRTLIRICPSCKLYTMNDICSNCGTATVMAIPMKYSPADKFQKYRIKLLEDEHNGKNNV
ncbi:MULTISPECIES: RNA-protein complex protein Nop10 [Ferroplasma]|jgi:H/ACA ribonucleoprotein complex subunit 3|uniref:Ribosome biogenesis protein Nop10 n=2 Tax=Ferroplasma TaxID=74968 RepID=S0AN93_FERAC|nr:MULTISPECIES: RNA-protein complex protein Nop10 [Ferroplasma]MCL4348552.1 RNA-protein complex protein Nop10 [Candidatus Thermoplasmatota archaeon]AGO60743.1 H/ACA RNA-protein complex component Nop10p [Ferroplasma acidarmanus Fer1]ARD85501.1 H/ACA RNP protein Nop10 [Ferroplasma acidiphilum]NOL60085.1 RNA-protein complex protein Nop10 [Ferroplasma acidiphilum]WMT52605.1 MAG: RNA-protein complex protein Nop10 [Ferroplasma acidiphilum]